MKCKHCGRNVRYGIWGWEHDDGFITCIVNFDLPLTSAMPDREKV